MTGKIWDSISTLKLIPSSTYLLLQKEQFKIIECNSFQNINQNFL